MSARKPFEMWREILGPLGPSSPTARLVLMAMLRHCDEDLSTFVAVRPTLAIETGLGVTAVTDALERAIEEGWLAREERRGLSSVWTLLVPEEASRVEALQKRKGARRRNPANLIAGRAANLIAKRDGLSVGRSTQPDRQTVAPDRQTGWVDRQTVAPDRPTDPICFVSAQGSAQGSAGSARERDPENRTGSTNPDPKPRRSKAAPTKRPEHWMPSASHYELGQRLGFRRGRVDFEAEKFTGRCDAEGKLWVDWDAAFGNWLRNARGFDDRAGVPREDPEEPLFGDRGEPWIRPAPSPPTPDEQAQIERIKAEFTARVGRFGSRKGPSDSEVIAAARANLPPDDLAVLDATKARRGGLH